MRAAISRKANYIENAGIWIENAGIWIEGERIREIGPLSHVQAFAPKNAEIVDLSGATVLPGSSIATPHLMASFAAKLAAKTIHPEIWSWPRRRFQTV